MEDNASNNTNFDDDGHWEPVPMTAYSVGLSCLEDGNVLQAASFLKIAANAFKGCKFSAQANHILGSLHEQTPLMRSYEKALRGYGNALALGREEARGDYFRLREEMAMWDKDVPASADAMIEKLQAQAAMPVYEHWLD